jgi:hypothetical protein
MLHRTLRLQRIQEHGRSGNILAGPGEGGKISLLIVGCHGLIYLAGEFAPSSCGFMLDVVLQNASSLLLVG